MDDVERTYRELRELRENLTATQARCTELLNENRAMKMAAETLVALNEWNAAVDKALRSLGAR
jgi:hypothetical protein